MLLAAMLAMVLVVAVPAVAQVAYTGDAQNSLGIVIVPRLSSCLRTASGAL